jgi:hypothetical protein
LKLADEVQIRVLLALLRKSKNAASTGEINRLLLFEAAAFEPPMAEKPWTSRAERSSRLKYMALRFLVSKQNADGSWGRIQEHRNVLTPLAVLAFMSCGEGPTSSSYGDVVINGLKVLVKRIEEGGFEPQEPSAAILIWCLAEAYGMTRIPQLKSVTSKWLEKRNMDFSSPWTIWALQSCYTSGIGDEMITENKLRVCMETWRNSPENLLKSSILPYIVMRLKGREAASPLFKCLKMSHPNEWRKAKRPMISALSCNMLMLDASLDQMRKWNKEFWPDIWEAGNLKDGLFWFSEKSLRLEGELEFSRFPDDEMNIYITSMILMSTPPISYLPQFKVLKTERESKKEEDGDLDLKLE